MLRFRTERLFGQPFEAWDGDRWVRHDPERLDNNPAEKAKQGRGEIFSIAFSPDGKRLAVGGAMHAPKDFFDRPVAEGAVRVDFETGADQGVSLFGIGTRLPVQSHRRQLGLLGRSTPQHLSSRPQRREHHPLGRTRLGAGVPSVS